MKRHTSIVAIALMAITAVAFTGCKKTTDPVEEKTYTLTYKINNECKFTNPLTGEVTTTILSPCFHFDFTYVDANGNTVEEHNVTAPWEKVLTIKKPFHAVMQGKATFVESELPDIVYFGTPYSVSVTGNGVVLSDRNNDLSKMAKDRFIDHVASHPNFLDFTGKVNFE